jgi:TP901 family phage tail tape measure protein
MSKKNVNVKLGADITDFTSKMKLAAKTFNQTGAKLRSVGKSLSVGLSAPLLAIGTGAVMAAANFEKSMNKVKAVTKGTTADFKAMDTQAKELGRTTQFSASQAADAMSFLGMAGLDAKEIMDAMPATLNLAAAGNLELATAADIASNVMSGFGAEAKDLGKFVDVLAAGFTNSNTDLNQLGEAMANAAPVASGFGVSIEETTAAIGLLSNAGIQGGAAGTSLKNILVQLDEQSESLGLSIYDAAGNMIPLSDQLAQLESKGLSTSDIMGKFGKIAGPGLLALMKEGSSGLSDLTGTLENSGGTAKKVADQQMKGLAGTMTRLKSATEGLAISFGELILPVIEKLVNFVTGLVTAWTNLDDGIQIAIITFATLAATLGPLIALIGAIASPIGLAVIALATLAAGFVYVVDNLEAFKERFSDIGWWQNAIIQMLQWFIQFNPLSLLLDGFNEILDFFGREKITNPFDEMVDGLEKLKVETKTYENEFGSFGDAVSNAADKAKSALGGIGAVIGFGGGGGSESSGESGGESGGGGGEESSGEESGGTLTGALTVVKGKFDGLIASSKEFGVAMATDFAAGMGEAIASGQKFGQAFKQIFADMLKQIIALIVQAAILAALFAMIPGLGAASGFAKGGMGFKDILSGSLEGRASGGPVAGGTPYMVGENGPELFMSNTGGNIVPNHALGGGGRLHGQFTLSGADMILAIDNQLAADTNGSNPGLQAGTASVL